MLDACRICSLRSTLSAKSPYTLIKGLKVAGSFVAALYVGTVSKFACRGRVGSIYLLTCFRWHCFLANSVSPQNVRSVCILSSTILHYTMLFYTMLYNTILPKMILVLCVQGFSHGLFVWAPKRDPNTYQLYAIYRIGAHGTDPTRIQQGPRSRAP